jgi:hypothetical protein
LQVYATTDTGTAVLNLVNTSYTATLSGTPPAFTADRGFDVTSSTSVNTQFIPSAAAHWTQNVASLGVWVITSTPDTTSLVTAAGSNSTDIYVRYSADTKFYTRLNDNAFDGASVADGNGFSLGTRTSSTARASYRDGTLSFAGTATADPPQTVATLIGNHPARVAAFVAGGNIDALQAQLYSKLRTYMTAVGVP